MLLKCQRYTIRYLLYSPQLSHRFCAVCVMRLELLDMVFGRVLSLDVTFKVSMGNCNDRIIAGSYDVCDQMLSIIFSREAE